MAQNNSNNKPKAQGANPEMVANKNDNLNKKGTNEDDKGYFNQIIRKMKGLWDLINHKGFWVGIGLLGGMFAFKHLIFQRFIPITDAQVCIENSQFSRVVLGNMMMLCYFRNPQAGQWSYCLSSLYPKEPIQVYEAIIKSGNQTSVSSMVPNEIQIGHMLGAGMSLVMLGVMINTIKNQNSFNSKKKKDLDKKQKVKTFADIGGCEPAKDAIGEIIDYIRNPEYYSKMGVRMPKGILMYGPPGTGKTLIAKAAATEAGIPVIYASGSEFVELYVGLGAKRIRDLFSQARAYRQPCMIFIDEIDAVGFKRGGANGLGSGNRETETTLNQLLNEMDGFEENDKIIVVAATNLLENLDPAIQRPGRFDRKIEIKLPDVRERSKILKIHLKTKSHSLQELDITQAATFLDGCSGAEIENLVNLTALATVRQARMRNDMEPCITTNDLKAAVKSFNAERKQNMERSFAQSQNQAAYRRFLQANGGQNSSS